MKTMPEQNAAPNCRPALQFTCYGFLGHQMRYWRL